MKKWECTVCGYIHEGETPPDECPLCGADSSQFVEVVEEAAAQPQSPPEQPSQPAQTDEPEKQDNRLLDTAAHLITDFHLHPITVHAPNGIMPLVFLLLLGSLLFSSMKFESAAFYCLVFILLNMPIVLYTGYVTWQKLYKGAMTPVFRLKIAASGTATVLVCIMVFWRILRPDVMAKGSSGKLLYVFLALLLLGAVGIAGHMGGKLVFGHRNK